MSLFIVFLSAQGCAWFTAYFVFIYFEVWSYDIASDGLRLPKLRLASELVNLVFCDPLNHLFFLHAL